MNVVFRFSLFWGIYIILSLSGRTHYYEVGLVRSFISEFLTMLGDLRYGGLHVVTTDFGIMPMRGSR